MTGLFASYLAIYNKKYLPNGKNLFPKYVQNCAKYFFLNFAKVAKLCHHHLHEVVSSNLITGY